MASRTNDPRVTEQRNPHTADIDLASPLEIVDLIAAEDRSVPTVVHAERERIALAVAEAEATFRRGGRLFYVGAGTSGRLGILDASECPPTFGTDPDMVRASSPVARQPSPARKRARKTGPKPRRRTSRPKACAPATS